MTEIRFNTKGHDGFIDFLKAYSILCVLFGHTFLWLDMVGYGLWAGMQVPFFILIQAFHCYKKEQYSFNIVKILKRVFIPFIVIEVVTFLIVSVTGEYTVKQLIDRFLRGGGYGPGAYYPWIYLQVALLLPLFGLMLKRCSRVVSLVVFLVLCEGLEVLCSIVHFPDTLYRLLCIRYFFLLYLAWGWVKKGIRIDAVTIVFSVISFLFIIYFEYFDGVNEPLFYNTNWKYHRWPCYYYVANGLTILLYMCWRKFNNNIFVNGLIRILSSSSYEIFLLQMSAIFLYNSTGINSVFSYMIWVFTIWMVSIIGGVVIHKWLERMGFYK